MNIISTISSQHVVVQALVFFGLGLLGLLAHWLVKWGRGEVTVNLLTYLFASNPRATTAAVIGLAVAEATAFSTGVIGDSTPIQTILGLGFLAGYSADSALNKAV